MQIKNVFYLPSGRVFLVDCDGYLIECTEMRDVSVDGKQHEEVRNATDPRVVWKHLVPYSQKWLMTVSTQFGCKFSCEFCSVSKLPFKGNLSQQQIEQQVSILLENTEYVRECHKAKIGFARMGEPSCNLDNVLGAIINLPTLSKLQNKKFNWLPCFNSILPKNNKYTPEEVLDRVIEVKEKYYNGFLHLQISCNSTDEETRYKLFGNSRVFEIESIINYVNNLNVTNRTVTLNFIVIKNVEVSVDKLKKMGLNKDKFVVKLIPLNHTPEAEENGLETYANYENYEELLKLRDEFASAGIPTVVDAVAKCEEAGLCCGQLAQTYL